jgi:2-polyprenyl-3-methyl-5-hydroxy-6-metoxy-1,4-benzoquinol methylase
MRNYLETSSPTVLYKMLLEDHTTRIHEARPDEDIDLSFDHGGWTSALGRHKFTHEEMSEWINAVISRLLEGDSFYSGTRRPRVLEIGCGTGMILFRLAKLCESYTAIDFMPSAVAQVRAHAQTCGLKNVQVSHLVDSND